MAEHAGDMDYFAPLSLLVIVCGHGLTAAPTNFERRHATMAVLFAQCRVPVYDP